MGTDRYQIHSAKCACGKGTVAVDQCSPDHPYAKASQTWLEVHCDCVECNNRYDIEAHKAGVSFVRKEDTARKKELSDQWHAKEGEIREYAKKRGYYKRLAGSLALLKTKAAIHRAIANLEPYSVGTYQTFLRHFPGCTPEWAEQQFSGDSLPKSMKRFLSIDDPELNRLRAESATLYSKSQISPKPAHFQRF